MVTEDRKRYGLNLDKSIGFNLSLSSLEQISHGFIDRNAEVARNQKIFGQLRVKAPSIETVVGTLSGGNQQKVVIGKALLTSPDVVFLDEPTRGIDVGAKLEVYEFVNQLTGEGKAVVLVSSELPELMGMSDRIVMLAEGHVGGVFTREEANPGAVAGRGDQIPQSPRQSMKSSQISVRDFSLFIALALIWAFFSWQIPDFVSPRNLTMLSIELSTTAVASLGMLLIILLAHIDLSVGSAIGLTGGIASVLIFQHQWSAPAAMVLSLVVGLRFMRQWAGSLPGNASGFHHHAGRPFDLQGHFLESHWQPDHSCQNRRQGQPAQHPHKRITFQPGRVIRSSPSSSWR